MINEDLRLRPPPEYKRLPEDWRPVRAIFNSVRMKFLANYRGYVEPGDIMHVLYFTCVRPEAREQGIMKALWKGTIDAATEQNYERIAATASSAHVQSVLEDKLGFREVSEISYDDFMFEAHPIFKEIKEKDADHGKLTMLVRSINSNMY